MSHITLTMLLYCRNNTKQPITKLLLWKSWFVSFKIYQKWTSFPTLVFFQKDLVWACRDLVFTVKFQGYHVVLLFLERKRHYILCGHIWIVWRNNPLINHWNCLVLNLLFLITLFPNWHQGKDSMQPLGWEKHWQKTADNLWILDDTLVGFTKWWFRNLCIRNFFERWSQLDRIIYIGGCTDFLTFSFHCLFLPSKDLSGLLGGHSRYKSKGWFTSDLRLSEFRFIVGDSHQPNNTYIYIQYGFICTKYSDFRH